MSRPLRRGVFNRIALRIGAAVDAGAATLDALHARVLALRGERR